MSDSASDTQYFTKAVAELGEKRPVVTNRAIFNAQGIKIIEQGVSINLGLYERLMQHQLAVPIEDSVSSTPTVNGAVLRASAEQMMSSVPFVGRIGSGANRTLLLDTLEKLPLPAPMAFQLTLAREVRPDIYLHSVLSALTAAWLSQAPLASRYDISMAAAAGLLHDIGVLHLDPLLSDAQHVLNRAQRRQLYSHPLITKALVERHHEYPKEVVRAVAEHHEFLNGSGYPRNLSGKAISPLGQVLSITEIVTGMFAPGRAAPELRLSVALRMNLHRYDIDLTARVLCMLQPQLDTTVSDMELLDNPVQRLLDLQQVLDGWPAELRKAPNVNAERLQGLGVLADQVAEMHRSLASVGADPQQLTQLGGEGMDDLLKLELTLMAGEAAWQLRSLARQSRRRWRLEPGANYPELLQSWLDRVDQQVAPMPETDEDNMAAA